MNRYNCPEEAQDAYEAEQAWGDEQSHLASEGAAAEADALARNEEEAMTNIQERCPSIRRIFAGDESTDICEINTKSCLLESNLPCEIYQEFLLELSHNVQKADNEKWAWIAKTYDNWSWL